MTLRSAASAFESSAVASWTDPPTSRAAADSLAPSPASSASKAASTGAPLEAAPAGAAVDTALAAPPRGCRGRQRAAVAGHGAAKAHLVRLQTRGDRLQTLHERLIGRNLHAAASATRKAPACKALRADIAAGPCQQDANAGEGPWRCAC